MNDQPSSKATADGFNDENWLVQELPYTEDVRPLGFLQLCADRRFHRVIQEKFKEDAELELATDYWIHADAGGTPKMEDQTIAPNYCYYDKGVRLMGWSAHGAGCGGFGENVPDHIIRKALKATFEIQLGRYPDARHFCYFVTTKKEGETEETVVYSIKI